MSPSSASRLKNMVFRWAPCTATWTSGRACSRSMPFATGMSAFSSARTSPHAVSTFPMSATSSTSTCRPMPRITCIGSAGRGRAGRSGTALSIVTREDQRYIDDIEKLIQRKIEWAGTPVGDLAADADEPAREDDRRRRPTRGPDERRSRRSAAPDPRAARPAPEARPARVAAEASPEIPPSARTQETTPRRAPSPGRGRPGASATRHDREDDDAPVIGLGDHVPSFLLRPVRLKGLSPRDDGALGSSDRACRTRGRDSGKSSSDGVRQG